MAVRSVVSTAEGTVWGFPSPVLVIEEIPLSYLVLLQVISQAVPLLTAEMELGTGGFTLQFMYVGLR